MKVDINMENYNQEELDGLTLLKAVGIEWQAATRPLEDIHLELAELIRDGVTVAEIEI